MPADGILIYGATGYTGKLIAAEAKKRGLQPVLAGRSAAKVKAVAEPLGFKWTSFDLADQPKLDAAVSASACVLHIAGPFSATSKPMVDACLKIGRHYLDITGEIDVFEACANRTSEAKSKGVMLMPGVGFDVVPSDCLAAHMRRRMPDARRLTIAIGGMGSGRPSRGTAKTMVESLGEGTKVRRGGKIVTLPKAPFRDFDYGQGSRPSVGVSWGDVATAWHSTAIPDIDVFFEAAGAMKSIAGAGAFVRWIMSSGLLKSFLKSRIDKMPEGPTDAERANAMHVLIGEVSNAGGQTLISKLKTPNGYTLTVETALNIALRVTKGDFKAGFQTPSLAYGADFILEFANCTREDIAR